MFLWRAAGVIWFIIKVLIIIGIVYGLYYVMNKHFGIAGPFKDIMSKISSFFKWLFSFGKGSIIPKV